MSLLTKASLIYTPNAVKANKTYSIVPNNGTGDLDFTRATGATQINSLGNIENVLTGVPRLNYDSVGGCPSLLLEPQRINSIRNSTMQGAVVGTPGTLPTNWAQGGGGGSLTTRTIVGTGIENGLTYIDIRYQGVNSGQYRLVNESGAIQSAVVGNNITFSSYIKLISGTAPQLQLVISNRDSLNAFISDNNGTLFNLTSTLTRYIYSANIQQVGTAYAQPIIQWSFSGITYDFTIRVAGSQFELGTYPTSYIPTTTGIVTRNADSFVKTGISSLIGQTEGTLFIQFSANTVIDPSKYIGLSDGTASNRVIIGLDTSNSSFRLYYMSSAGTSLNYTGANLSINTIKKIAVKYAPNNLKLYIDGILVYSSTSVNTFTSNNLNQIGLVSSPDFKIYGMYLFTTSLTDTECIALTT